MIVLYHSQDDPKKWVEAFAATMPEIELRVWPDIGNEADVEAALVFAPPLGVLASLPALKIIISKGAGVDHLFRDPDLPTEVPIVRMVDSTANLLMSQYVAMAALRHHRHMETYQENQRRGEWRKVPLPDSAMTTVGVLGLGAFGMDAARTLKSLGFSVIGWSRTAKENIDIESDHGDEALIPFLGRCQILVCLLALTPETDGILNRRTLAALPRGAYLVNVARGGHLVEEDLLEALASDHLAGATVDVFRTEPLPADHPFWTHPKITVTPHVAADAITRTAVHQVVENLRRLKAGEPLLNQVDVGRGY